MQALTIDGRTLHYREDGAADGPALVFSNSLGTDLRAWDPVLPHLPAGLRIVRYDTRGHGLSDTGSGDWGMADLVADLGALLDHLGIAGAVVCGLSVGGLVAQGLAAERPDLVRALVLSNTAAKIGADEIWDARIGAIDQGGMAAVADATMERWFSRRFVAEDPRLPLWRTMLLRTPADGYVAVARAIRDTDLRRSTARLTLPCLAVAGSEDGATPPDLVRETAGLIDGSRFELIRGAGHIPAAEAPERFAELVTGFLDEIGHG